MRDNNQGYQDLIQLSSNSRRLKRRVTVKKVLLGILISFIIILVGTLAAIPAYKTGSQVNNHINFNKYYYPETYGITSSDLSLVTTDGIKIAAHEVYVENPKAVVIFISGIQNPSVTAFYDHARLLSENGYASILYEMRAHGGSEGDLICLGFKEYLDTQAVVNYINSSPNYSNVPIVVYGVSMGGATAINSIGKISDIDGLISISAYSSYEDVFYDSMVKMDAPKLLCNLEKPFVRLYLGFKYGFNSYNISPKNEIKNLGGRPALIMHSKGDTQVPFASFERIVANAPSHIETWTREGDLHFFVKDNEFDKLKIDPEYTEKIISFLDRNFSK